MHYNRQPIAKCIEENPWLHLCLNIDYEPLQQSRPHAIVNIAGSTILHQHEITFATGTSRLCSLRLKEQNMIYTLI